MQTVNAKTYKKHLEKQLFPEVDRLMNGTSLQLPISSFESCSKFLEKKVRFEIHLRNPLDYHFWNKIKEKVYEDRFGQPFKNEDELKKKIKKV